MNVESKDNLNDEKRGMKCDENVDKLYSIAGVFGW